MWKNREYKFPASVRGKIHYTLTKNNHQPLVGSLETFVQFVIL